MQIHKSVTAWSSRKSNHPFKSWTKFYKSLGYKLIEGVFYEDQEYATIPLSYAKRIRLLDDELYVYRLGDVNQSVSTQSQLSRLPHFEAVLFKILEHEKNLDKLDMDGL